MKATAKVNTIGGRVTIHRRADRFEIHIHAAAFGAGLLNEDDGVPATFACSAHDDESCGCEHEHHVQPIVFKPRQRSGEARFGFAQATRKGRRRWFKPLGERRSRVCVCLVRHLVEVDNRNRTENKLERALGKGAEPQRCATVMTVL